MSTKTPHACNPILHAPRDGADYVRCRTCAKCSLYEIACTCPHCHGRLHGDAAVCEECGDQVDPDEQRTGADAECWEPRA